MPVLAVECVFTDPLHLNEVGSVIMERKVQALTCHLDSVNVKSFLKKGRKKRHGFQLADIMQVSGKCRKHLPCLAILPSVRIVHGNENEVSATHRQHQLCRQQSQVLLRRRIRTNINFACLSFGSGVAAAEHENQ